MELHEVKGLSVKITKMIFFPHGESFPKCWPGQEQTASLHCISMSNGLCHCKLQFQSPFALVSTPKDYTVYWCKDREGEGKHLESASCIQTSPSSYQGTSESTISPHHFSLLEITFPSALVNSVKEYAGSRGCLDLNPISPSARRWMEWFIIKISYFSSALENT